MVYKGRNLISKTTERDLNETQVRGVPRTPIEF